MALFDFLVVNLFSNPSMYLQTDLPFECNIGRRGDVINFGSREKYSVVFEYCQVIHA